MDSDPIVEDVDIASNGLVDVMQMLENMVSGDDEGTTEGETPIGTLFTPPLCEMLGIGASLVLSEVYEMLISHWLQSLPSKSPSRARVTIERAARAIAGHICLAAYQYPVSLRSPIRNTVHTQRSAGKAEVVLALRRKTSATRLLSKEEPKVQPTDPSSANELEGDTGGEFTRPTSSRGGALPTPDLTPSLRSRSSSLSMNRTESLASRRLRTLVSMKSQSYNSDSTAPILEHWSEGVDPWTYDWESTQQAIDNENGGESPGEPALTPYETKAKNRHKRRRMESSAAYSQPQPNQVMSSQPQTEFLKQTQASSQGDLPMMMSQPEPGLHGGRMALRRQKHGPKRAIAGFK